MYIDTKESEIRRWTCTHLLRQHQPQNRERIVRHQTQAQTLFQTLIKAHSFQTTILSTTH